MAVAATVTSKAVMPGMAIVVGTLTFSGNYAAGGDSLDFASVLRGIPSSKAPAFVQVDGAGGFFYEYDHVNKKVKVRENTTPGANSPLPEHTAAAYAAGVTGDVVRFMAIIPR